MVKNNYASSIEEAFHKYLSTAKIDKISRKKLPPKTCIELIHMAGGVAVLAHPCSLKIKQVDIHDQVRLLKYYGLDGIEAFHPDLSQKYVSFCRKLAAEFDLIVTCGSDFHGLDVKRDVFLAKGSKDNLPTYDESIVEELINAINRRR